MEREQTQSGEVPSGPASERGICARGLAKRFPSGLDAVVGVDLDVAPGEVVGLLGPNGAGKTTTLRMLGGIIRSTRGWARVGGEDVARHPLRARAKLGFLSGTTALYARLSVREVLRYFGELHSMSLPRIKERTEELVDFLEMASFAEQRCGTLSSGQWQRANIARAFLHEPPVLVLDEPTAALDVVSGHFILEAIRKARGEGKAVLFSTHIMSEAELLCDRIVLLHEGRVLDSGPLPDILRRAGRDNLTEAFIERTRAQAGGQG